MSGFIALGQSHGRLADRADQSRTDLSEIVGPQSLAGPRQVRPDPAHRGQVLGDQEPKGRTTAGRCGGELPQSLKVLSGKSPFAETGAGELLQVPFPGLRRRSVLRHGRGMRRGDSGSRSHRNRVSGTLSRRHAPILPKDGKVRRVEAAVFVQILSLTGADTVLPVYARAADALGESS